MTFVIKLDVLEKWKNIHQLKETDLSNTKNMVSLKEVEVGFGVKDIKKLQRKDYIPNLRKETQSVIIDIIEEILEKSPILLIIFRF